MNGDIFRFFGLLAGKGGCVFFLVVVFLKVTVVYMFWVHVCCFLDS